MIEPTPQLPERPQFSHASAYHANFVVMSAEKATKWMDEAEQALVAANLKLADAERERDEARNVLTAIEKCDPDWHETQVAMADAIGEPETDACARYHEQQRDLLRAYIASDAVIVRKTDLLAASPALCYEKCLQALRSCEIVGGEGVASRIFVRHAIEAIQKLAASQRLLDSTKPDASKEGSDD